MKVRRFEGRLSAESSLFETCVIGRERNLRTKGFFKTCKAACGVQPAGQLYFTNYTSHALFSCHELWSVHVRSNKTSQSCTDRFAQLQHLSKQHFNKLQQIHPHCDTRHNRNHETAKFAAIRYLQMGNQAAEIIKCQCNALVHVVLNWGCSFRQAYVHFRLEQLDKLVRTATNVL